MLKFTLGHDAEVFLLDGNDVAIPSIGLIGGDKAYPKVIPFGALQEDNVMAELNITPAKSRDEWLHNTNKVREKLELIVGKHGLRVSVVSFQTFQPKFLRSKQAKMFGCDPDFNIYTGKENIIDSSTLMKNNQRTAGGHIHIGLEDPEQHPNVRRTLVQACDVFIGMPLAIIENKERKAFYGRAGSYRNKKYGIEYRTPSNIWLTNEELMVWMYEQVIAVVRCVSDLLRNRTPLHQRITEIIGQDRLIDIINSGNSEESLFQCHEHGIYTPPTGVKIK